MQSRANEIEFNFGEEETIDKRCVIPVFQLVQHSAIFVVICLRRGTVTVVTAAYVLPFCPFRW